jgi:hypothetical protein
MQIYELTQPKKRKLNELDFGGPPPKKDYGTGVGPGVQPQYTATPRMKTAPQPEPAPQLPAPAPAPGAVTPVASAPELQTIDAPKQLAGPKSAAAKQIGTNYDPNVIDVDAKEKVPQQALAAPAPVTPNFGTGVGPGARSQMTSTPTVSGASTVAPAPAATPTLAPTPAPAPAPSPSQPTYNVPLANMPAQPAMMPTNMSTTGAPTPAAGIDPALAAAGKVKMGAPKGRKANIGGAIANAMQAYNANKVGLGYLLPKDAKNEVYTDSTGKITIDGKPYDATNPDHQQLVGKITIAGKPYNGANPEHRAAYLAFKNTAGRGGSDTVKIDADGKVTIIGQPFDPGNPAHVQAYRQHVLGSSVAQTPPPAPPQQQKPPAVQQPPPAAQQKPPAAQGSPAVAQALTKLGFTAQQAAAMAAKVPPGTSEQDAIKLGLAGKLNESLTWSRNFDPSRTLLKKIRQL